MRNMEKREVIVVGGGPGGASAAYHLAKAGIDVLMLEKDQFPRDKPCGDGQVQSIHPLFKSMGIYEEIEKYGYKCPGTLMSDADENFCVFNYKEGEFAFCTPRYIIDDIINKAAVKAGSDYIENFEVTDLIMKRGQSKGIRGIHNGAVVEIPSDLVVIANGAHSMLSRKLGFYEENPDYVFYGMRGYFQNVRGLTDVIEFHYADEIFMPAGYIWMFPMSKTKANVGVFITEAALQRTGKTTEEILQWWRENTKLGRERLGNAELIGKLKGWRLPSGIKQNIYVDGVMGVGDAVNMIEPLFGGGFPHAMVAGVCAAKAAKEALEANDFSKEFLKRYSDYVDAELGSGYAIMEALRKTVFSNQQDLKDMINFKNTYLADVKCSGGEGMALFLKEKRGFTGSLKSVYGK